MDNRIFLNRTAAKQMKPRGFKQKFTAGKITNSNLREKNRGYLY